MSIYTIIGEDESEELLRWGYDGKDRIRLELKGQSVSIDMQQMAELGALFLALTDGEVDWSSCSELLDGYGLSRRGCCQNSQELAKALSD